MIRRPIEEVEPGETDRATPSWLFVVVAYDIFREIW